MTRWRNYLTVFAAATFCMVMIGLWLNGPQRQRKRFHQVELGMSRAEVVAIMGNGQDVIFREEPESVGFLCGSHEWWERRPTYFIIVLGADGTVTRKYDPFAPE